MNIFYSPSQNIFFDGDLKDSYMAGSGWSDDLLPVDDKIFTEFIQYPPEGKKRIAGKDGLPTWVNIPSLTKKQLIEQAEIKRALLLDEANRVIADWRTELALGIIDEADKAQLSEWMKYIKAVKVADTSTAPDINWPEPPEA